MTMAGAFFSKNKRVLLPGHSEGNRPALWLERLGIIAKGLSLPAPTEPSLSGDAASKPGDIADIAAYEASLRIPQKVAV